jgi:hypothetical protein
MAANFSFLATLRCDKLSNIFFRRKDILERYIHTKQQSGPTEEKSDHTVTDLIITNCRVSIDGKADADSELDFHHSAGGLRGRAERSNN